MLSPLTMSSGFAVNAQRVIAAWFHDGRSRTVFRADGQPGGDA
jgi:hypothetical protein